LHELSDDVSHETVISVPVCALRTKRDDDIRAKLREQGAKLALDLSQVFPWRAADAPKLCILEPQQDGCIYSQCPARATCFLRAHFGQFGSRRDSRVREHAFLTLGDDDQLNPDALAAVLREQRSDQGFIVRMGKHGEQRLGLRSLSE
jgi:hypothetical protein